MSDGPNLCEVVSSESDEPVKLIKIVDVPFSFTFAMYSPDSNKMSNLMRCYITQI